MGGHAGKLLTEEGETDRWPKRQVLHMILEAAIVMTGVCRAHAEQQGENKQWTDETAGSKTVNHEASHGPLHRCSGIKDRRIGMNCQSGQSRS